TIIILVIIIVILGIGLYFSVTNTNSDADGTKSVSNSDLSDLNIGKNDNSAININTTGKSYSIDYDIDKEQIVFTNEIFAYRAILPDDWSIDKIDDSMRVAFFDPVAKSQEFASELLQGMKIEIYAEAGIEDAILPDVVAEQMSQYSADEIISQENVVVSGEDAIKVITDIMGYSIVTYVLHNDILYTIVGYVGDTNDKEKYGAKYSEIVAKFEFL
ncbi:hypothetical protein KKF61_06045, partial [Patescibacteria group bacterium]|nr:hypothetical protein [Patescibacteria group bacterium]